MAASFVKIQIPPFEILILAVKHDLLKVGIRLAAIPLTLILAGLALLQHSRADPEGSTAQVQKMQ